jgi:hypothetical protein
MPKTVLRHTTLNGAVKRALSAKPDYSAAFTQRVRTLAKTVEDKLALPVQHDADMNYSAGQQVIVWLDKSCHPVLPNDRDAKYRLVDYVSSKGPFFAFVVMRLSDTAAGWREKGLTEPRPYWTIIGAKDLLEKIASIQKKISAVLRSSDYALVEEPVLSQEVEGHVTELDGKPATVFEVLFSEIH